MSLLRTLAPRVVNAVRRETLARAPLRLTVPERSAEDRLFEERGVDVTRTFYSRGWHCVYVVDAEETRELVEGLLRDANREAAGEELTRLLALYGVEIELEEE